MSEAGGAQTHKGRNRSVGVRGCQQGLWEVGSCRQATGGEPSPCLPPCEQGGEKESGVLHSQRGPSLTLPGVRQRLSPPPSHSSGLSMEGQFGGAFLHGSTSRPQR